MRKKLYELHSDLFRPNPFAAWAKPEKADLNIPRTKHLGNNDEVIWQIKKDGVNTADHIEMSGFYASAIISYGNDRNGRLRLMKHLTVPTLRVQPNVTQSSFSHNFTDSDFTVTVNNKKVFESPTEISIKGNLKITSAADFDTEITREFLPAVNQPALIEIIHIFNKSKSVRNCKITAHKYSKATNAFWCVGEKITAESSVLFDDKFKKTKNRSHEYTLNPNENCCFYCVCYAYQNKAPDFSINEEITARRNFINGIFSSLKLETPIKELNAQFSHCILRGSESIFKTKNGLMHAPGGGNYYAALWTNDQCEYANPFFPFSGYPAGIEQSINCYSLYEKYMDKSDKPMRDKRACHKHSCRGR